MTPAKYYRAPTPAVETLDDGAEVCNLKLKAGKYAYHCRMLEMAERQRNECPICHRSEGFFWEFDHQDGRGMNGSHRDDRIEIDGEWHNAALCHDCNQAKGSKRYHWLDGKYVPSKRGE